MFSYISSLFPQIRPSPLFEFNSPACSAFQRRALAARPTAAAAAAAAVPSHSWQKHFEGVGHER